MTEIRDYPSRLSDAGSRKHGTMSYLPPMDAAALRKQVEYIVKRGWTPALEHVEPERSMDAYWYMWKLPMFGIADADTIIREAAVCHEANPGNHVRLIGYDNKRQTQGTSMIVYRGRVN